MCSNILKHLKEEKPLVVNDKGFVSVLLEEFTSKLIPFLLGSRD